ncbi:MAG TPA: AmiS/UreI family transporter, partial [Pseudonocardia sp.]
LSALVYSGLNFVHFNDSGFGVIWLYWAFLWALFFVVLGLKRDGLSRYTGAVCAIQGWVTGWLPALLLLTGRYADYKAPLTIALAIFGVVVFGGLFLRMRTSTPPVAPATPTSQHLPA